MSKEIFKDTVSERAAPSATAAPKPPAREIVEQWWRERVHNSPVSRDTRAYNFLQAAVEDLKRRLEHHQE